MNILTKDDRIILGRFLNESTWQRLMGSIDGEKPPHPDVLERDALSTAAKAHRRAGFEECLMAIVRLSLHDQEEPVQETPATPEPTKFPLEFDIHDGQPD